MITGGARGQGRAHALALAAEGADIVLADAPAAMADLTYPLATEDDLRVTAKLVDELPHNATGKLLRRVLTEMDVDS